MSPAINMIVNAFFSNIWKELANNPGFISDFAKSLWQTRGEARAQEMSVDFSGDFPGQEMLSPHYFSDEELAAGWARIPDEKKCQDWATVRALLCAETVNALLQAHFQERIVELTFEMSEFAKSQPPTVEEGVGVEKLKATIPATMRRMLHQK